MESEAKARFRFSSAVDNQNEQSFCQRIAKPNEPWAGFSRANPTELRLGQLTLEWGFVCAEYEVRWARTYLNARRTSRTRTRKSRRAGSAHMRSSTHALADRNALPLRDVTLSRIGLVPVLSRMCLATDCQYEVALIQAEFRPSTKAWQTNFTWAGVPGTSLHMTATVKTQSPPFISGRISPAAWHSICKSIARILASCVPSWNSRLRQWFRQSCTSLQNVLPHPVASHCVGHKRQFYRKQFYAQTCRDLSAASKRTWSSVRMQLSPHAKLLPLITSMTGCRFFATSDISLSDCRTKVRVRVMVRWRPASSV